jgi:hypothetical protein
MNRLENLFGAIRPRSKKNESDDFLRLGVLVRDYLTGNISRKDFKNGANHLCNIDLRQLHSRLGPPLRRENIKSA